MQHLPQATDALGKISPTPDAIILGAVAAIVAYGLLMGQAKIKTLALSIYVGIVVSEAFGPGAASWVNTRYHNVSGTWIRLGLFILPIVILELGRHHGRHRTHSGFIMTAVLAVLTAALAVSSGISLLDQNTLSSVTGNSSLASGMYHLRLWWIGAVPLAIVGESFIREREPR